MKERNEHERELAREDDVEMARCRQTGQEHEDECEWMVTVVVFVVVGWVCCWG